jgi:S1-C subfamily serine protease
MLKRIAFFLSLLFISPTFAASQLVNDTYSPTVKIKQGKSNGSGTVIFSFGRTYVLTNFHVVSTVSAKDDKTTDVLPFEKIDVITYKYENIDNIEETTFQGKVVLFNRKMDLALVEVVGAIGLPVARIDFKMRPDIGENVFAVGSGLGHTPFMTDGLLSRTKPNDGYPYYLSTSPIVPGNSGGGLYMKCGDNLSRFCLIGVPSRVLMIDKGVPIPHMGFSVRLQTVAKFLLDSNYEFIINPWLVNKTARPVVDAVDEDEPEADEDDAD